MTGPAFPKIPPARQQLMEAEKKLKRGNKYHAEKTLCSIGHPHPSRLEADTCEIHILREKAGDIRNLKWQSTVELAFGIRWKVDWEYEIAPNWERGFSEAKGAETRDYKLKLKMWPECGKGRLEIWKAGKRGPALVKTITPEAGGE